MNAVQYKTKCPKCGKLLKFAANLAGAVVKCPACENKVKLPATLPEASGKPTSDVVATEERWKKPPVTGLIQGVVSKSHQVVAKVDQAAKKDQSLTAPPQLQEMGHSHSGSSLSPFMGDGQDPQMIGKLLTRVQEICTASEDVKYMAVQQHPVANISPDAVVLTNRRAIVFRQKVMGRLDFVDVRWLDVKDVHVSEGVLRATLSIQGINGHVEKVEHVPKAQARKVYRIGQEMEEEMIEFRRERMMEEDRNRANSVVVNTAVAPQPAPSGGDDLVGRLKQLKEMLEADLISQAEFDAKKSEIMRDL